MQVFQKHRDAVLGGIDEAIAILKLCSGRRREDGGWDAGWDELDVHALHEGDEIAAVGDGAHHRGRLHACSRTWRPCTSARLARRSLIMRNVRDVVAAARGKPIFYFPARHDHWLVQTGDGWAAHVAGAIGVSTDAQASWWGGRGIGTVPHALIAAYGGDTVAGGARVRRPLRRRDERHGARRLRPTTRSPPRWRCAEALGDRLWGVRLDTSETLVDRDAGARAGRAARRPASRRSWCERAREALDAHGFGRVRIVVSGGFDCRADRALRGARASRSTPTGSGPP